VNRLGASPAGGRLVHHRGRGPVGTGWARHETTDADRNSPSGAASTVDFVRLQHPAAQPDPVTTGSRRTPVVGSYPPTELEAPKPEAPHMACPRSRRRYRLGISGSVGPVERRRILITATSPTTKGRSCDPGWLGSRRC
jgi:hypothetical protein